MYAIWLLFNKDDNESIGKIIDQLAKKYNAPKFLPHITIYGLVDEKLPMIKKIVKESIDGISPVLVNTSKLDHSDNIWKTVFIKLQQSSKLLQINYILSKQLSKYAPYIFEPHVSLIYKNLDRTIREKIVSEIQVNKEFTIDKIGLLEYSPNVQEWKIVDSFVLIPK